MGNIIDELLTEEEKEMYDQETLKQQDQAIMQLNNDKKHYQNLIDSINTVLKNERLLYGIGAKDFREMVRIRDNLNERVGDIDKEIDNIQWYNG